MPDRSSTSQPATPSATPEVKPQDPAIGCTRTRAGSNYGDFAPTPGVVGNNPSRGAEMERDVAPPDADFSRPPLGSQAASADAHVSPPDSKEARPKIAIDEQSRQS